MRRQFFAMLLLLAVPCLAAANPLQTLTITFPETPKLNLADGRLTACEEPSCRDGKPFYAERASFGCSGNSCTGEAPAFPPYLKLTLTRNGTVTLTSNVFAKKSYDAAYTATLTGDSIDVNPQ